MALTIGQDNAGDWAAVECDQPGCYRHVAVRPAMIGTTGYDLVCAAFDLAESDGWLLDGRTWCPDHQRYRRPRRLGRLSERFPWARVHKEPVKG